MKILDRTAVILEIFAQHAQSREGQLQVELGTITSNMTCNATDVSMHAYTVMCCILCFIHLNLYLFIYLFPFPSY